MRAVAGLAVWAVPRSVGRHTFRAVAARTAHAGAAVSPSHLVAVARPRRLQLVSRAADGRAFRDGYLHFVDASPSGRHLLYERTFTKTSALTYSVFDSAARTDRPIMPLVDGTQSLFTVADDGVTVTQIQLDGGCQLVSTDSATGRSTLIATAPAPQGDEECFTEWDTPAELQVDAVSGDGRFVLYGAAGGFSPKEEYLWDREAARSVDLGGAASPDGQDTFSFRDVTAAGDEALVAHYHCDAVLSSCRAALELWAPGSGHGVAS